MGFGRPATAVEAGEAAPEERCHGSGVVVVVVDDGGGDRVSGFGDHWEEKCLQGCYRRGGGGWDGWMDFEVRSG